MNLNLAVENLGLNKKEAQTYLALLALGKTTAYNVSIRSGIKKPTTYVILDQLVEKGFALKIPCDKKQLFIAESPRKCLAKTKEQLAFTEDAMPELLAMRKKGSEKISVSYYEGLEGMRELYQKMLKTFEKKEVGGQAVGFMGHAEGAPKELVEYWKEFNDERAKRGIKVRGIAPKHISNEKYLKNQARFLLEARGIPLDKYNSNISVEVYDRFVQIVSFRELQGVLIDNPDVAKAMRQIFEMNWDLLSVKQIVLDKKKEVKEEEKEIKPDEEIDIKIGQIADL